VYEQELQQLATIFGEAHSGISLWLPFLNPDEVKRLVASAQVIQEAKATALKRQKERLGH